MAVTGTELHWSGTTGGRSLAGKRTYTAVYWVYVDTIDDQTATICDYFQNAGGSLPRLGDQYRYRNDYDPTVVLTNMSPKRTDKSQTQWEMTLTYETPTGEEDDKQQNKDPNGNLTEDPLQWVPRIDIGFTTIQIPIEGCVYISGFNGGAAALCPSGKVTPVMNSAFIPFVPPPERDFHISVVRRQWYGLTFSQDTADQYIGRVNSAFYGGSVLGYGFGWKPFTAKIINIGGSLELINDGLYWHNQIEVHINPLTWRRQIADRGLHRRAMPGDLDATGRVISASDLVDGIPPISRITGADDLPIVEPVLFNGNGAPLITDVHFPDPVWITYAADPEVPFPQGLMGL